MGTKNNPFVCDEFEQAFDIARESNHPVYCRVGYEFGKAFPSGKWDNCDDDSRPNDGMADERRRARILDL